MALGQERCLGLLLLISVVSHCFVPVFLHARYLHMAIQTGLAPGQHRGQLSSSRAILTCQSQKAAL